MPSVGIEPNKGAQIESRPSGQPTPGAQAAPAVVPAVTPLLRIFIVEDSTIILDNLVATLEEMAPVKVVGSASDESTASQKMIELGAGVDLAIIDIFLKVGSGLGLLRRLAQHQVRAKRAVLTNYATSDMRQRCLALGADEVFDKSNDLDSLIAYCTRLAEGGDKSAGPTARS